MPVNPEKPGLMGELVRELVTSRLEQGWGSLTARPFTDDEFSDFIIGEDKNAVGKGTEPPG